MTYEEYKSARKEQIKNLINLKLMPLQNQANSIVALEDAQFDYQRKIHEEIEELYKSIGLFPDPWKLETSIQKVQNPKVKQTIWNHFFELNLLQEAIQEIKTPENDATQREHAPIEELVAKMSADKRAQAITILRTYMTIHQKEPKYIGSGQTTTAFKIGDKVIKFGEKRKYKNIPFCLDIYDEVQYAPHSYMYIVDLIKTGELPSNVNQTMYNALRSQGFVWLDPKTDNIGIFNGQLRILDDVDIHTEEDVMKGNKASVLEAVSHTDELAQLELEWLKSQEPNFDINQITHLFSNRSSQTIERIQEIKDEYYRRNKTYQFDPSQAYYESFGSILSEKVTEYNTATTTTSAHITI